MTADIPRCVSNTKEAEFQQTVKHARLCSDQFQALKREPLKAPGSLTGDFDFCIHRSPLHDGRGMKTTKATTTTTTTTQKFGSYPWPRNLHQSKDHVGMKNC